MVVGTDFSKAVHDTNLFAKYQEALQKVLGILLYYDQDKKIPFYGFGGKLPPNYQNSSNCFAMNGNIFQPQVDGLEELIRVFSSSLTQEYGLCFLSEMIEKAIEHCEKDQISQQNQNYYVLCLFVHNNIHDLDATINALIKANDYPLSIVVIGIGSSDFATFNYLDSEPDSLNQKTQFRQYLDDNHLRDILQFVPYELHADDLSSLAQQVLFEVPGQFNAFMKQSGIRPNVKNKNRDAAGISS